MAPVDRSSRLQERAGDKYSPYARPSQPHTPVQRNARRAVSSVSDPGLQGDTGPPLNELQTPQSILQRAKSWLTPWKRNAASSKPAENYASNDVVDQQVRSPISYSQSSGRAAGHDGEQRALSRTKYANVLEDLEKVEQTHGEVLLDEDDTPSVIAHPPSEVRGARGYGYSELSGDDDDDSYALAAKTSPMREGPVFDGQHDGASAASSINGGSNVATGEHDAAESPNQLLARFFRDRQDRPLDSVEIEGVMSILRRSYHETSHLLRSSVEHHTPRDVHSSPAPGTPMSTSRDLFGLPSQPTSVLADASGFAGNHGPIFSPSNVPKFHIGSIKTRDGSTPRSSSSRPKFHGPTQSTPFRRRLLQSGSVLRQQQQRQDFASRSTNGSRPLTEKLDAGVASSATTDEEKRSLEDALVPQAKRQHLLPKPASPSTSNKAPSRTAASILDILGEQKADTPPMLNPSTYTSPYAKKAITPPKKPANVNSPQSFAKSEQRSAYDEIERSFKYATPSKSAASPSATGSANSAASNHDAHKYPPSLRSFLPPSSSPAASPSSSSSNAALRFRPARPSKLTNEISDSSTQKDGILEAQNQSKPPVLSFNHPTSTGVSSSDSVVIDVDDESGEKTRPVDKGPASDPSTTAGFSFKPQSTAGTESAGTGFSFKPQTAAGTESAGTGFSFKPQSTAGTESAGTGFSFKPQSAAGTESAGTGFSFKPQSAAGTESTGTGFSFKPQSISGAEAMKKSSEHPLDKPKGADASVMVPGEFTFGKLPPLESPTGETQSGKTSIPANGSTKPSEETISLPDDKAKALAASDSELPRFSFHIISGSEYELDAAKRAANVPETEFASVFAFPFTVSKKQVSLPSNMVAPANAPTLGPAPETSKNSWASAGFKFPQKDPGSWECSVCMITNSADKDKCAACESPR